MLRYRKIYFIISGIMVAVSLLALLVFRLNLGIDFTGGSLLEVGPLIDSVRAQDVEEVLENWDAINLGDVRVQPTDSSYIIRMRELSEAEHRLVVASLKDSISLNLTEKRFESIGPIIGAELKRKALYQIALVAIAIVLYVAYAFRRVSKLREDSHISWKFGLVALVALFHDVIITLGVFAVLGKFFSVEIDNSFIAAILLVLGYSVNDTIVVFDRVRENLIKHKYLRNIEGIMNESIAQTIVRSINTSTTTLLVLFSILLFGGGTIFYFVLALIIGISLGTYSSIFIATPLLYEWEREK